MFIERQLHPTVEFDPAAGQQVPAIAYYFSNQVDLFKSVLPELLACGDEERVLVVSSPLSQVVDETIRLHRNSDDRDTVVVDEKQREFFGAIRHSLKQALLKIEQVQFAPLDEDED